MRTVVTREWRAAATVLGLLFLAGRVVLAGVLTVVGSPDAGRIAQFLGIVFAVPALAISSASQNVGGRTD
jgi:hypothetical protein